MVTERDASAAMNFFESALLANEGVHYVSVAQRPSLQGGYEWIIEIGVDKESSSRFPSSLPIPLENGTLSEKRVPLRAVYSQEVCTQ